MTSVIDENQINEAKDILDDKFSDFISNYIFDTESIFSEIDICLATGQFDIIQLNLHRLKSSSHQVGAISMFEHIINMEKFMENYKSDMAAIPFQTRIGAQFQNLRGMFADYRAAIQDYL